MGKGGCQSRKERGYSFEKPKRSAKGKEDPQMYTSVSGAKMTSPGLAQNLESYLRRLLEGIGEQQSAPAEAGKGAGAPQKLPSAALWTALVLGVLFGVRSLRGVWRSRDWQGYACCDETVCDRLEG